MYKFVMVRHGQSEWNLANRFTGWTDVDLSEQGVEEARAAGRALKKAGYEFDLHFTSVLKRAIKTGQIILEEMDQLWVPVLKSWRLNERHYGALQGLNKAETAEKYGADQVHQWRRSYDTLPPLQDIDAEFASFNDRRYALIPEESRTRGENLKTTLERVIPFWEDEIAPAILAGHSILIAAHGNSLRALAKHIERISDDDIMGLEIPTGKPLVYHLDEHLNFVSKEYLE
ncbi:MAG: 2,3-diphosphoglycerate-dependent phosphoglycerate mutase [Eubacteriales bacterium]|nr:2,3-diphosphoglycerate-dependent phosphoglycerate mutase [Eubacteriales bacterium]